MIENTCVCGLTIAVDTAYRGEVVCGDPRCRTSFFFLAHPDSGNLTITPVFRGVTGDVPRNPLIPEPTE